MDNDNELDALIKDIAIKHGIAVGRDDPILIQQTLNNQLIQANQQAQQALLEVFKSELEELSHRWRRDAKEQAERILNVSLQASQATMERMLHAGTKEAVAAIKSEVDASIFRISQSIKASNRLGFMNLIAAGFTLLAAIVFWIALR